VRSSSNRAQGAYKAQERSQGFRLVSTQTDAHKSKESRWMRRNVRTVTGTLPTMAAAVAPPPGSGPPKGGGGPSGSGRSRFLSSCIDKKAVTMAFLS